MTRETDDTDRRSLFPGKPPTPSIGSEGAGRVLHPAGRAPRTGIKGTGTHNDRAACQECGGPKEPGTRKMRCAPCIAKWYYTTPSGEVRRRILCRCGGLKEQGKWYCDECRVIIQATNGVAANERRRDKYLQAQYGINQARYLEIKEEQEGVCAICSRPAPGGRNLDVDHCHKTGAVRGLLCARCNQQLLPIAKDDPVLLRAAADYLEREPLGWAPQPEDLPDSLKGHLRKNRDVDRPLKELPRWMSKNKGW